MIRDPISKRHNALLVALSISLLVGGYWFLSYRQHQANKDDTTLPTFAQILHGARQTMLPETDGSRWLVEDFKATFGRLAMGLSVAVALSIVTGIGMGCFAPMEAFFLRPLSFLAKIPPTAAIPVFFVLPRLLGLNGDSEIIYVGMVAFGIYPTLGQAIYQATLNDVPTNAIYKTRTLGASIPEVVWNHVFKQVLPRIIENTRLSIGPAMVYLLAAEYALAELGFGYRLRMQSRLLNMSVVYWYLILLGLIGWLLDWAATRIRRWLCPWFEGAA